MKQLLIAFAFATLLCIPQISEARSYVRFTLPVATEETKSILFKDLNNKARCDFVEVSPNRWECAHDEIRLVLRFHNNTYKLNVRSK